MIKSTAVRDFDVGYRTHHKKYQKIILRSTTVSIFFVRLTQHSL